MTVNIRCSTKGCTRIALTAISNRAPRGKSLVTTIWQDEEDAPKNAARYCGPCAVHLAANLAALTDSDLGPVSVNLPTVKAPVA